MKYRIRTASLSDIEAMYRISLAAHNLPLYAQLIPSAYRQRFDERYSDNKGQRELFVQKMTDLLTHPDVRFFVAEDDQGLVGYVGVQWQCKDLVVMRGLFVHPAKQGQGVGSQLLMYLLERVGPLRIELRVLRGNDRARMLYERFDFHEVGTSEAQYFGAQQAVMARSAY